MMLIKKEGSLGVVVKSGIFGLSLLVANSLSAARYVPPYCELIADAKTGELLYADNSKTETQPASLTKMMTLYVAFKEIEKGKLKLNDRVHFSMNAVRQKPSKLGVSYGSSISVREAIVALIVKSANDVAVALSETICKTQKDFVKLMNCNAKMLGMNNTNFSNPSGWKDSTQYTTAEDMLKLARALLVNMKSFYPVFSIKEVMYCGSLIKNHNNILGDLPGGIVVDGMKTGYVAASGFNLVASAKKDNKRLIVVVLGGPSGKWRDNRVKHLITCGFNGATPDKVAENGHLINCYNGGQLINCGAKKLAKKIRKNKTVKSKLNKRGNSGKRKNIKNK